MSMLEDLFLEDEAGEAQELERVLEGGGDEYEERPLSPTSDNDEEREDEAVEDKRRVDPSQAPGKVRVVRNPRFVLNPARLTGPRGIQVIPDHYKDFKFKGKGHEKEDLDMVLKKLEHWAYRLYPKFGFEDCLKKIETLGKKRPVMVHLQKIRSDQLTSEETVVQRDSSDEEAGPPEEDEFDKLLQQQIELARATPAPSSVKKPAFSTPSVDRSHIMPKATSSPSISEEQKERMLRNRRLAEERRLAKLRSETSIDSTSTPRKPEAPVSVDLTSQPNDEIVRKHNRSNIIDSSDEEEVAIVNQSITVDVDVHKKVESNGKGTEIIDSHKSYEDMDVILPEGEVCRSNNDFDSLIGSNSAKDSDDLILNDDNDAIANECLGPKSTNKDDETNKNDNDIDDNISDVCIDSTKSNNIVQSSPVRQHSNDVAMGHSENYIHQDDHNKKSTVTESSDGNEQPIKHVGETNDIESNDVPVNNISKDKDNSINASNKENVDSNIAEDVMDIDFSDDF